MGDVERNENDTVVDKDGKVKELVAEVMPAGTVSAIINNFSGSMRKLSDEILKASTGTNLDNSAKALKDMGQLINSGEHHDFYRKNKYLANVDDRQKFLGGNTFPGCEDRDLVYALWEIISFTIPLRKEIAKFITEMEEEGLWRVCLVIRFEALMRQKATPDFMSNIDWIFKEFDELYTACKDPKIYKAIGEDVNKKNLDDYELTILLQAYINEKIKSMSDLSMAILDINNTNPAGYNDLMAFDHNTREYVGFGNRPEIVEELLNKCKDLRKRVNNEYKATDSRVHGFLSELHGALYMLENMLEDAIGLFNDFKNKADTAPFSVMHVSPEVIRVSDKYSLGPVSQPFTHGTNYHNLIKKMPPKLRELVKIMVDQAPVD